MARIRTIKPDIWEDQKVGKLDVHTALTWIGLISLADDEGRGRADPLWLRSRLHPYRTCTVQDMEQSLTNIGQVRLAVFYSVNGQEYYWIPKFKEHQVINKPKPSRLPPPPGSGPDGSGSPPVSARAEGKGMEEEVEKESEGNGQEGKGVQRGGEPESPGSPSAGATGLLTRMPRSPLQLRGKARLDAIEAKKRLLIQNEKGGPDATDQEGT